MMINITSFYPFQSLLRVTQEFREDRVSVKEKSLSLEQEFEFAYKDINEISDSYEVNFQQLNFGFYLLLFTFIALSIFNSQILAHLTLLRIGQFFYILGLVILILGLKKTRFIYLADEKDRVLTTIRQDHHTRKMLPQIFTLIKDKSNNLEEISVSAPFPDKEFTFEYVSYDFSNLEKMIDRFYEDKVIGVQRTMFREGVYQANYNKAIKNLYRRKVNNGISGWLFTAVFLFSMITLGFYLSIGISFGMRISREIIYLLMFLWGVYIASLPLNLLKREVVELYNKNGRIEYWTYVNKNDKDKLEHIIEFIQSKIPADENE